MDFMKAVRILRMKRMTAIGVALAAFLLVAIAPQPKSTVAPIYTSKAKLLITPPSSNVQAYGGQSLQATVDFSWFADPTVLTELLRSEELLARVVQSSDIALSKEQLAYSIAVEDLSNRGFSRGVRLFALSVQNPDPKGAQKLTRLLTEEFVRYVEDLSAREFANTRRFIEELVLEAEGRRDSAEAALMDIKEKYLALPSDEEMMMQARAIETRINELERTIVTAQAEVSALSDFRNGNTQNPPWQVLTAGNSSLSQLEANVTNKKMELVRLSDIYTETNENVVKAKRELNAAEELYQAALNDTVESLYRTKNSELQQSLSQRASLSGELTTLLRSRMTEEDRRLLSKYESELQVWERNHLNLQQQLYQARVVEQSSRRQGAVNVLEQPGLGVVAYDPKAKQPTTSSKKKRLLLAIPFCLVLGVGAAFLQEYLTSSTKLRPRVEEALELPVLAVIPATPSELTVDWETFKRPDKERLAKMELASTRAPGFEERKKARAATPAGDFRAPSSSDDEDPRGGGFGSRFLNQK